jgi:hypothetical protein
LENGVVAVVPLSLSGGSEARLVVLSLLLRLLSVASSSSETIQSS